MGAGTSKSSSETSQHVFAASTPTRFSPTFVSSLEESPQSDSTRSALQELKIQARVKDELDKLANEESSKLLSTTQSLAAKDNDSSNESPSTLLDFSGEQARKQQLSHESVSKEIDILRKKLDERKKLEQADPGVQKARDSLVQCLRLNDRKPLDCWEEKERFKREVWRLEKQFVDKTVR